MVWRPARLSAGQLEERRLAAAREFPRCRAGRVSQSAIARAMGVSRQTVSRWYHAWQQEGRAGLRRRLKTGRPRALAPAQWGQLAAVLARGAVRAGFDTERWTLRRVAVVVERELGVTYHFRSLGRVLRAHGWSPQRPATRALERNEALIHAWLHRDWPRIKRGLVAAGGSWPSWTRRVSHIGPASARPGPRSGARPCCTASPSGGRSRAWSP